MPSNPLFGQEYGSRIGSETCPRCNAANVALRALQRGETHILVVHLVCHKCHLVQYHGLTTIENLELRSKEVKLERALARAKTKDMKRAILAKLRAIEERRRVSELGL